jgi:outer membrane protein assembly factor BamB
VFAVGTVDGTLSLVGFSLDDGSERWRRELTAAPESTHPIATQQGVVVSDDGALVVHDRESGERTREIDPFDYEDNSPRTVAVDDGTAFVTGSAGGIFAVDLETGTQQWHRDAPLPDLGICVGTETVVLPFDNPDFSSGATTISALDRESGETRWYYGFDLADDPNGLRVRALVDGAVFFTANGELGALGDVDA